MSEVDKLKKKEEEKRNCILMCACVYTQVYIYI